MSFDQNSAFEADEGFLVSGESGIFSGSGSPVGSSAPVGSYYLQSDNGDTWKKIGQLNTDWIKVEIGSLCIGGVGANYIHLTTDVVGGGDVNGN